MYKKNFFKHFQSHYTKRAVLFPNLILVKLILPCLHKVVDKEKLLATATSHLKQRLIYTKVSIFFNYSSSNYSSYLSNIFLAIFLTNFLAIFLAISLAIFLVISLTNFLAIFLAISLAIFLAIFVAIALAISLWFRQLICF